jgi:hypothetical protein
LTTTRTLGSTARAPRRSAVWTAALATLCTLLIASATLAFHSATAGSAGYQDIASDVHIEDWLMDAWEPNPADYSSQPSGNFRMFCQFSHVAHADPIVAPGDDRFMHLHMFFGNTAADHDSTYQSLRSTGDSTCDGGPLNRTAYWMPAVFDGQDRVVAPSRFELYYKAENTSAGTLDEKHAEIRAMQAYPNGLRMIAGAPGGAGLTWGWRCGDGATAGTIPDCGTGQRLTGWVRFPYCWDGRNLDSADHRSHMAYGTNNTWGGCPASHPVHLPELTEFAHFDDAVGSGSWYLSSDRMNPSSPAPNGSTFHADWFGAWDNSIQDRWVENCLRGMRSASNGNLCDGQQLKPAPAYSGPTRLTGWSPAPETRTPVLDPGGSVRGTVTDAAGNPLGGATVLAAIPGDIDSLRSAHTAPDGTYEITGLDAGDHVVYFTEPSKMPQCYEDNAACHDAGNSLVAVSAGTATTGIDAALAPRTGGSVAGRVTGEGGDGIAGVRVWVIQRGWTLLRVGFTGDDGSYHVGGLPDGDYFLAFDTGEGVVQCYRQCRPGVAHPVVDGAALVGRDTVYDGMP